MKYKQTNDTKCRLFLLGGTQCEVRAVTFRGSDHLVRSISCETSSVEPTRLALELVLVQCQRVTCWENC